MSLLIAVAALWIACGFVGGYIATAKNRPYAEGFLFGACLGVIGLLIAALLPTRKPTPKRGRIPTIEHYKHKPEDPDEDAASRWLTTGQS